MPKVDIDCVCVNFMQTLATELVNKSSLDVIEEDTAFIGGDGMVPSWFSLLTRLKWNYEQKKIMLKCNNKIRLI